MYTYCIWVNGMHKSKLDALEIILIICIIAMVLYIVFGNYYLFT